MAAHNTVLRVESLAFLPGFGFGIACSALVGQYLGARRPLEARKAALLAGRLTLWTMAAAAVPMVFFPHFLLSIMVSSEVVVNLAVWPMVLAGLAQPAFAYAIARGSALRGAGETLWPMISTIGGIFAIRAPIIALLVWFFVRADYHSGGLLAVWIAIFIDLLFRGVFNTWVFARGRWMRKEV
jgi:Na+-driven multidrug efflux pump